jgi:hypothetical protein
MLFSVVHAPFLTLSTIHGHSTLFAVQSRPADLSPYLEQLRALPFIRDVTVARSRHHGDAEADLVVTLQTPTGKVHYVVELKRSQLNRAVAADLLSRRIQGVAENIMVFSKYVPPQIADELAGHGVQFIDAVGNQHVHIDDRYFVRASGKRPARTIPAEYRSTQPTGYLVYFALLADRSLRSAPIRTVAAAAGVSKSAVSNAIARLEAQKLFVRRRANSNWIDTRALLERWLVGYAEVVRPRFLVGAYRAQDPDPIRFEKQLEVQMPRDTSWAFGGGAAAYRLTGHYRGESSLIHVSDPPADLPRRLRVVRADHDPKPSLVLLRAPGPLLLQGVAPRTAHPLLVYTELLCAGDERAREAAAEIRDTRLKELLA